jgi:hypothetical protein
MEHLLSAKDAYNSYLQTCTRLQIIHKDDQLLLDNMQSVRIQMFSINMMLHIIVNFLILHLLTFQQSKQSAEIKRSLKIDKFKRDRAAKVLIEVL